MLNFFTRKILVCIISVFLSVLLFSQETFAKRDTQEWELGSGLLKPDGSNRYNIYLNPGWNPHEVRSKYDRGLNLYNQINGHALVYQRRGPVWDASKIIKKANRITDRGISLGWLTRSESKTNRKRQPFTFHRKSRHGVNRPLEYGEVIAIHLQGANDKVSGYLRYQKRPRGINLVLNQQVKYQWKITGGATGAPIRHQGSPGRRKAVGLYNTVKKDFLVYCKRKWGVNLRWAKDCERGGNKVVDHRKKTSKSGNSKNTVFDHRKKTATPQPTSKAAVMVTRTATVTELAAAAKTAKSKPSGTLLAPSNLKISNIGRNRLTLSWQDNSTQEFGVLVFRLDPVAARLDKSKSWKLIMAFEERISSNVTSTGARSDEDFELDPDTNYCYRIRAYSGFSKSEVSEFSKVVCTKTLP